MNPDSLLSSSIKSPLPTLCIFVNWGVSKISQYRFIYPSIKFRHEINPIMTLTWDHHGTWKQIFKFLFALLSILAPNERAKFNFSQENNNFFHQVLFLMPLKVFSRFISRRGVEGRVVNYQKQQKKGLPWWHSGWESACRCRGHGFEPWSGKIPHATEQLSPWAITAEPARLELVLHNKRGRDSERPAHHDEEWPLLAATGESTRTETKTQHSQKNKNK